jgi:hypothetical protein
MSFAEADPRAQRARLAPRSGRTPTLVAGLGWLAAALLGGWQLSHRFQAEEEEFVLNGPSAPPLQSARRALRPSPSPRPPATIVELPGESGAAAEALAALPEPVLPEPVLPEPVLPEPVLPAPVLRGAPVLHEQSARAPAPLQEQPGSAEPPALPDWAIGSSSADAGPEPTAVESEARRQRLPRGTNDAPIFD